MSAVEIKKNVYWVGVKNPELRVFDIIMTTEKGTTYNSYLIVDEKVVLVDTVKDGFFDEFIANIRSVIGDRPIDYIVVNHTEPDHSGSLNRITDIYKDAVVYGSKAALLNIAQIINRDFNGKEAKGELNIGKRTLEFISAPFLHWPDTIFTYDKEDNLIFTCDGFGSHFCGEDIFNDTVEDFSEQFKYYYDCIMSPFKGHVLSAIDKIRDLRFDMIATSHGPILRKDIQKFIDQYTMWSEPHPAADEKSVLILYVSAYGYTRDIAEALGEGVKNSGVKCEVYDISELSMEKIIEKVEYSKALFIGSPTINQDAVKPVWDVLSLVSPIASKGKTALTFGSYGWSGEAVPMLNDRLKSLKFKLYNEGIKIKFKPTEADLSNAVSLGQEIGNGIK